MLWDEAYECGIPAIDAEHKELFVQVGVLMDAGREGRVGETLDFLGGYVVKHFAHEQLMHRTSKYPNAAEHKAMHDRFVLVYSALRKEYGTGDNKSGVLEKLVRTVELWLREHIAGMDREFAAFYRAGRDGDAAEGNRREEP